MGVRIRTISRSNMKVRLLVVSLIVLLVWPIPLRQKRGICSPGPCFGNPAKKFFIGKKLITSGAVANAIAVRQAIEEYIDKHNHNNDIHPGLIHGSTAAKNLNVKLLGVTLVSFLFYQ